MGRTYMSRGCRGALVRHLQDGLLAQGVAPQPLVKFNDGDFGGKTADAVRRLQAQIGLPATSLVDEATWRGATQTQPPSLFERALQLTADFEGHGFGLAQGNFDGAGITWGIIGFTLQGGELGRLMREIDERAPGTVDSAFGDLAAKWRSVLASSPAKQIEFADSVSIAPSKARMQPAWVAAFARLGAMPVTQDVQMEAAHLRYFAPALDSAEALGLVTERGVALCFDTHVQSGGIRDSVFRAARALPAGMAEEAKLRVLANAIADAASRPEFREDVRSRRLCIGTGRGTVHGAAYDTDAWGVGLIAA